VRSAKLEHQVKTELKIAVALGTLAAFGIAIYFLVRKSDAAGAGHSRSALPPPAIELTDVDTVTKLDITIPSRVEGRPPMQATLEKKGRDWFVIAPYASKASAAEVKSALDTLVRLRATGEVAMDPAQYAKNDLDDAHATHVVVFRGEEKALDLYFGRLVERGELVRVGGVDGVFAADGYAPIQPFASSWRDRTFVALTNEESASVRAITIDNDLGELVFERSGRTWRATSAAVDADGNPITDTIERSGEFEARHANKSVAEWTAFDPSQVDALLKTLGSSEAVDFPEPDTTLAEMGLDHPRKTGGVIRIALGDREIVVDVGRTQLKPRSLAAAVQDGKNRYAKVEGRDDTVYVIPARIADWAFAARARFEKGAAPP
jgi:hypothetical protein